MRIFKFIALLLISLLVIFLCIGIFSTSIKYTNTVEVNASPEKAFRLFTDTSKMHEWMPGYVSFTSASGTLYQPGSKWNLVLMQDGQRYEMVEIITAYQPNEQYSFILENAVLQNHVDIYFKSNGPNKTLIVAENAIKGNNVMWRAIFYFYKNEFHEQGEQNYIDLKKMIESN